jgi:hypothetical protein
VKAIRAWTILHRSRNQLDGFMSWYEGDCTHASGIKLFQNRELTRKYIKERYGYIAERIDLKKEPYGWRMPVPVRILVNIEEDKQ